MRKTTVEIQPALFEKGGSNPLDALSWQDLREEIYRAGDSGE